MNAARPRSLWQTECALEWELTVAPAPTVAVAGAGRVGRRMRAGSGATVRRSRASVTNSARIKVIDVDRR